ncbi:hypothetical protein ACIRD2_32285 [Streptomyces sp. NPDC093595]|uniref:hypothetical protein n=1 Tax=Streptomyces sp. NPDC093595 TaxID=3366045 RepID=UPI003807C935
MVRRLRAAVHLVHPVTQEPVILRPGDEPDQDAAVTPAVLAWLLAQLGPNTDQTDLTNRYSRLGSARLVAGEVLAQRRARLLADPLRMTVDGVVTIDQSNKSMPAVQCPDG